MGDEKEAVRRTCRGGKRSVFELGGEWRKRESGAEYSIDKYEKVTFIFPGEIATKQPHMS